MRSDVNKRHLALPDALIDQNNAYSLSFLYINMIQIPILVATASTLDSIWNPAANGHFLWDTTVPHPSAHTRQQNLMMGRRPVATVARTLGAEPQRSAAGTLWRPAHPL